MNDWKTVRLGDVCEILNGYAFDSKLFNSNNNGTPLIRIRDVVRGFSETYTTELADDKFLVRKGDLLIGMDGEFNCSPWNSEPSYLNQRVCKLCFIADSYDKKYVFYSLHKKLKEIEDKTAFVTVKHISSKQISDIAIINRPLNEQRHIAFVLEKCTELITKYKRMLEKYDALIKSRFIEMFGTEKDFSKWNCCCVEDVADVTVGVVIKPTQYYCEKGIPAFRSLNIGEMKVNDSDWVYFTEEGNEKNKKSILKENDILVVRSGAPGKSCVITKKYEGYNVVDAIIAHPNLEKINPVFLCMFTNMPHGMNQIKAKTGGAAQQHFNVGGYNALKMILPPLSLQNDFASFVQQIDKSKFAVQKSLEKAETLYKSLLQEYFG